MLPYIYDFTPQELQERCRGAGLPAFRASQICNWLYRKHVTDPQGMRNLPQPVRDWITAEFYLPHFAIPEGGAGVPAQAQKLIVPLADGDSVEAVIIPARRKADGRTRYTLCISCQVGCRFNCAFCASGKAGFLRNLSPGEIVSQLIYAATLTGTTPANVVFMGIGEPFDNYDNTLKAARIFNNPDALKIGARKITVSTCGIIPGIQRFASEEAQFELSVSLHAPDNATRSRLMPVNKRYPLPELIEECRRYTARTNRIITFEYTLIRDINDSREQARQLTALLSRLPCRVNLIPLSPVAEFEAAPSSAAKTEDFTETLRRAGINVTLRNSQGSNLKAACGQLRFSKQKV